LKQNKDVVRRSIEALNKRDWPALDALTAPDYVDHNPLPGANPGWQGMKDALTGLADAFPDFQVSIEDMIAEGDKVVVRLTASGTHKGEFMGIAPTNKRVTIAETIIHRIAGGKVVEEWPMADLLGFFQQLGAVTMRRASK
jgi:steroid delta-isomerase-like uncharacterized protein